MLNESAIEICLLARRCTVHEYCILYGFMPAKEVIKKGIHCFVTAFAKYRQTADLFGQAVMARLDNMGS